MSGWESTPHFWLQCWHLVTRAISPPQYFHQPQRSTREYFQCKYNTCTSSSNRFLFLSSLPTLTGSVSIRIEVLQLWYYLHDERRIKNPWLLPFLFCWDLKTRQIIKLPINLCNFYSWLYYYQLLHGWNLTWIFQRFQPHPICDGIETANSTAINRENSKKASIESLFWKNTAAVDETKIGMKEE